MIQLLYGPVVFFALIGFYWHECGENPALFCYRMGCVAYFSARHRVVKLMPNQLSYTRIPVSCSTPSGTYCTPSTMSKV